MNWKWGQAGIEPATSPTLKENLTTRPLAHNYFIFYGTLVKDDKKKNIQSLPAGLEPATYWLTANRSANWAMEALNLYNYQVKKKKIRALL